MLLTVLAVKAVCWNSKNTMLTLNPHSSCLCVLLEPRLSVDLLGSGSDSKIGSLLPIDTSASDNCLTPPYIVGSYCLNFNGSYTSPGGLQQQVKVGSTYRLQARVTGPVAMADRALGAQEDIVTVSAECSSSHCCTIQEQMWQVNRGAAHKSLVGTGKGQRPHALYDIPCCLVLGRWQISSAACNGPPFDIQA